MARLVWTSSSGGTFYMGLPETDASSVTLSYLSPQTYANYSDFIDALKTQKNVDYSQGTFLSLARQGHITSEQVIQKMALFEYIYISSDFVGTEWTSGHLKIIWSESNNAITGNLYANDYSLGVVFTSYDYDYDYTRLQNPFIYNKTSGKLIYCSRGTNLIGVESAYYGFYFAKRSSTYSELDVDSLRLNNADPDVRPDGGSSDDPYDPSGDGGGYSGGGGGPAPSGGTGTTGNGGLHDDTSDAIPTPTLPSDISISGGLFTAYNPSASQLASFGSALWNMQVEDINDVLRFLFGGDAFNAVIGLHLLPVAPATGGSQSIKLGNWDTGVSAPKISSQYKQVSFGSILLPEYWGNCIDYAPYTKIQLALPYIGIVDVDTDDVLGSTNTLTYNIDVLSGAICATLHCVKFNLSSVIYQWSGACAVSLPFSGASYNSVLGAIAGVAAAGMGFASMAAGPIGAALPAAALAAGAGAFGAGSAASIMGTMKGKVQKSGSFGANSGALGIMTPYFILTRPVQSVPETWQADKGYPANISAQLGTVTGYTEVSEINLECSGTEAEKKEIIDLLKKGVLF